MKARHIGFIWLSSVVVLLGGCQPKPVGYRELTVPDTYFHVQSGFTFPQSLASLSRVNVYRDSKDVSDVLAVYGGQGQGAVVILHLLRRGSVPTERFCKVAFGYLKERFLTQFDKAWVREIGDTDLLLDAEQLRLDANSPDVPLGWDGPLTVSYELLCNRYRSVPVDPQSDQGGIEIHTSWHLAYSVSYARGEDMRVFKSALDMEISEMWQSSIDLKK